GNTYWSAGRDAEALRQYEASSKILRALGDQLGLAKNIVNTGLVYSAMGRYPEALAQYRASLKVFEAIGDPESTLRGYWGIGAAYRFQGKWKEAAAAYRKAIDLIELVRAQAEEYSLQTSSFADKVIPYEGLIICLMELGQYSEALAVSEQAKA